MILACKSQIHRIKPNFIILHKKANKYRKTKNYNNVSLSIKAHNLLNNRKVL